ESELQTGCGALCGRTQFREGRMFFCTSSPFRKSAHRAHLRRAFDSIPKCARSPLALFGACATMTAQGWQQVPAQDYLMFTFRGFAMTRAAKTKNRDNKLKCYGSDCHLGGTSGFDFHHTVPSTPDSEEYRAWESARDRHGQLRVFGPEDLLDMARDRGEAGLKLTRLTKRIRRLRVGAQVKLCFLV